jgi:hypothetical protein
MIYCGKAEFGQFFPSFASNSGAILLKRPKNLTQIGFPSLRSVKPDRLLAFIICAEDYLQYGSTILRHFSSWFQSGPASTSNRRHYKFKEIGFVKNAKCHIPAIVKVTACSHELNLQGRFFLH